MAIRELPLARRQSLQEKKIQAYFGYVRRLRKYELLITHETKYLADLDDLKKIELKKKTDQATLDLSDAYSQVIFYGSDEVLNLIPTIFMDDRKDPKDKGVITGKSILNVIDTMKKEIDPKSKMNINEVFTIHLSKEFSK